MPWFWLFATLFPAMVLPDEDLSAIPSTLPVMLLLVMRSFEAESSQIPRLKASTCVF